MAKRSAILLILVVLLAISSIATAQNTAELLGYPPETKLLIVNADDFGMCHAENKATIDLLFNGQITSATAMPPCPWFKEAAEFAKQHPELGIGVHSTLTSEWKFYKWGPTSGKSAVPSLVTPEGFFPNDTPWVESNAETQDVEREIRAQLDRAIQLGLQPTHLDNHMGSVYGMVTGRDFLDIVFKICAEYGLPFRLPRNIGEKLKQQLAEDRIREIENKVSQVVSQGFVLPDYLITVEHGDTYEETWKRYESLLRGLNPGVTELYIHVAVECPEIKAITNAWQQRAWDYEVFKSPRTKALLDSLGVQMISYRPLQGLQRKNIPPTH